jgi:hypothetical protein
MPDHQTTQAPIPEPLELRLLRDLFAEQGFPLLCRRRHCRRIRHCSGAAHRAEQSPTSDLWLPACVQHARPEARREFLDFAGPVRETLGDSTGPRQWPDDEAAAAQLRVALARLHRIHTRPGLHPENERAALAAWRATDPQPDVSDQYRRAWHRIKARKRHPLSRPMGEMSAQPIEAGMPQAKAPVSGATSLSPPPCGEGLGGEK